MSSDHKNANSSEIKMCSDRLFAGEPERNDEVILLEGYRQMTADEEQESEALQWAEALIGDAY